MGEGGISREDPPGEEEWWNFDLNVEIPNPEFNLHQQTPNTVTKGNRQ